MKVKNISFPAYKGGKLDRYGGEDTGVSLSEVEYL